MGLNKCISVNGIAATKNGSDSDTKQPVPVGIPGGGSGMRLRNTSRAHKRLSSEDDESDNNTMERSEDGPPGVKSFPRP